MEATHSPSAISGNMSAFCRLCLEPPEESQLLDLSLIYDEDEEKTYCDCFTICTQIELRGEESRARGLPHNLCKSCGLELQMAYDFYKKVEESKRILRQLYEQQELEQKQQEEQRQEQEESRQEEQELVHSSDEMTIQETEQIVSKSAAAFQGDMIKEELIVMDEMIEETLETTVEFEDMEEHLDMEEYHTMEDGDDAETIQIKIDLTKNDDAGEEYTIETIPLDEEQVEQLAAATNYNYSESSNGSGSSCGRSVGDLEEDDGEEAGEVASSEMSWQQAVVTVANESHLPLKSGGATKPQIKAKNVSPEEDEECNNTTTTTTKTTTTIIYKTPPTPSAPAAERKRYTGKYSCDFCGKEFPNYSRMTIHRRMHETDRPKFVCGDCGRLYATKQAMEVHIRSVHTKTAGHICPICEKIYAIRKGLEIHMRYHNGDFPYVCDLCGKKFAQMSHLTTHKNVKHNSVRFCCDHPDCGKFFTSSASLRNHEFTHGQMPFECEFCQRGYPAKSKLKVHLKLKHGQIMTLDQMEHMRKFHVKRTKLNLVKVVECED